MHVDSIHFASFERFIVVLYDRTSPLISVKEELFCKKIDQDALLQHVMHQAGVWTTSTSTQQAVPSPEDFSWTKTSGTWMPVWMSMPEVSKACHELIRCCCKGNTNCTCAKAGIACSTLCNN